MAMSAAWFSADKVVLDCFVSSISTQLARRTFVKKAVRPSVLLIESSGANKFLY
jgi:hypothetical protein